MNRANWFRQFLCAEDLGIEPAAIYEATQGTPGARADCFAYAAMRFGEHPEFLTFRKAKGILGNIRDYPFITLISGHCLFSGRSLTWRTSSGMVSGTAVLNAEDNFGHFEDFVVDPRPSLYELEAGARLAGLVAAIADRLPPAHLRIRFSLPRGQYYLALLGRYQRGELSKKLLHRWVEAVDQRYTDMLKRILSQLRARSTQLWSANSKIETSDGLADLVPEMREEITSGRLTDPATVFARLRDRDKTWALLHDAAMPGSWRELSHLSYVVDYLEAALWRQGEWPRLLVAVEDPGERLIFGKAQQLARSLRGHEPDLRFSAFGTYALERVLTSDGIVRRRSRQFDPGYEVIGPDQRPMPIDQLLDLLYPSHATACA